MDVRFALVEPILETIVIDHPRRQIRESMRPVAQEPDIADQRWPLWTGGVPDSPSYPWEWKQPPAPDSQAPQPQPRLAAPA